MASGTNSPNSTISPIMGDDTKSSLLIPVFPNNSTNTTGSRGQTPAEEAMAAHIKLLQAAFMEPEFQLGLKIQRYGAPIIIILGLIGNTLSFLIMIQRGNRGLSTCIYLAALAVTDNGSLLTLGYLWVVTEFYPTSWTDAGCKGWVYVVFLMTAGSAFTLVVVTLDRFIAIRFPFKAATWSRRSRIRNILIITYVAVAIFYIPMALMSAVVDGTVCAAFAVRSVASQVLSNVNLVVLPIIPFFVILIMNIIILRTVYKSQSFHQKNKKAGDDTEMNGVRQNGKGSESNARKDNAQQEREKLERSRNHQLTIMMLLVSFAYLIIILPISLRVLAYAFIDITASPKTYAVYVLLYSAINLLLFTNNAINFYLYCISGSKFRSDLKKIFGCCQGPQEEMGLSTSSNTITSDIRAENHI